MIVASRLNRWALGAIASALLLAAAPARAQTAGADEEQEVAVETIVAKALIDRGMKLFRAGDFAYARKLFIEALERDPKGPHAGSALALLRQANAKLGRYQDDGLPKTASGQQADAVIDPYAGGGETGGDAGGDGVLDPYAGGGEAGGGTGDDGVLDPYAGGTGGDSGAGGAGGAGGDDTVLDPYAAGGPVDDAGEGTPKDTRRELLAWSGTYGFLAGLGIAGDSDSAALYGLLGAGGGVGVAHWVSRRFDLSQGQVSAIETAGTWGALNLAFLGHLFDGTDSDYSYEESVRYAAVGGLLGIAGGTLWARRGDPNPDHLAFANSMAAYGAAGGLLLGVAISPPEDEAYTLNAAIGSTLGLAGGLYFAPKVAASRRRTLKMDLGAALGAGAPWALIYPLIEDDTTNDDEQTIGVISMLTLGGGAYLAWWLTRGDTAAADESAAPPVAAMARRNFAGAWSFGVPIPRPMENPALAPLTGGFNLGVDLLGGQF